DPLPHLQPASRSRRATHRPFTPPPPTFTGRRGPRQGVPMRRSRPTAPFIARLFLAPLLVAVAGTAWSQVPATDGTLVSVSAQAEATRVPDIATVSAGVVTQAADANAAMQANAKQMDGVMRAIRAAGIAERDVQTSGITLNPQYRYAENQPPVITGYQASNTVSIKVRDIGKLGEVLDALVSSGA